MASVSTLARLTPSLQSGGLAGRQCLGYTVGMKTAVSLPDDLFRAAERQAKRARKSRSQLYAEALSEYLARHAPDEVTEAMNRVVERLGESGPDRFLAAAGQQTFERTEW
jgi:hypothetical protein